MTGRAALRWSAAALFGAATLLYVTLWMMAVRFQPAVELGYDSSYLAAEQAQLITLVLPDSPAERAGMRPGDRLLAIDGLPLADAGYQARAWTERAPGEVVRLTLRGPGDGAPRSVTATLRRRVPRTTGLAGALASEILNAYPLPFVVVGLAVLFLRLDDWRAWLLAVVFAGFATTPAFPDSLGVFAPGFRPFTRVYQGLLLGLFGPLFYLFFATFPARSPVDRRLPWLKWAALASGVPMVLGSVATGSIRLPLPVHGWVGDERSAQLGVWWLLGVLSLGVLALAANFFRAADEQARRKTRVVFLGTAVALVPNLLIVGATNLAGYREPPWLAAVRAAFAFLMPMSLAYAVVKHRVLEIPVLLRRGARYLLVQRGFTIVLALLTVGVIVGFSAWLAPMLAPLGQAALPWGVAAGAALGTVLLWGGTQIHRRVGGRIDRAFFRQAYDGRAMLQDLAGRAARITDRAELATVLHRHVVNALHPVTMAVYLRDRDGQLAQMAGTWPSAPAVLPVDGIDSEDNGKLDWQPAPEHVVRVTGRDRQMLGVLALGPRRSEEPYSGEDADLLAVVASQAALALDNLSLAEQMAGRLEAERRHEYELTIAQDVQQLLLPQRRPPLARLDYAGTCTQARVVGGDYFDFLDLGPGRLGFVIADVSGKGISAALLMANLQAIVRSHSSRAAGAPDALVRSVNALFHDSTAPNRFATMFFGDYDERTRTLTYVNCGHNPPLLLRADGGADWLAPTAVAIGFFGDLVSRTAARILEPGDVLVMYSDGITEAWSEAGEEYGEARLLDVIREHRDLPARDLIARVVANVKAFSAPAQSDDWTLIVARVRAT